jgi:hypothetical protein
MERQRRIASKEEQSSSVCQCASLLGWRECVAIALGALVLAGISTVSLTLAVALSSSSPRQGFTTIELAVMLSLFWVMIGAVLAVYTHVEVRRAARVVEHYAIEVTRNWRRARSSMVFPTAKSRAEVMTQCTEFLANQFGARGALIDDNILTASVRSHASPMRAQHLEVTVAEDTVSQSRVRVSAETQLFIGLPAVDQGGIALVVATALALQGHSVRRADWRFWDSVVNSAQGRRARARGSGVGS